MSAGVRAGAPLSCPGPTLAINGRSVNAPRADAPNPSGRPYGRRDRLTVEGAVQDPTIASVTDIRVYVATPDANVGDIAQRGSAAPGVVAEASGGTRDNAGTWHTTFNWDQRDPGFPAGPYQIIAIYRLNGAAAQCPATPEHTYEIASTPVFLR